MDQKISVIMVDGGFRESFHALDYFADQALDRAGYELIWVEYTDRLAPAVAARDDVRSFCLGRDEEPQVLGYAYNKGIIEARGDLLVIADADVACERDFLDTIAREHERLDDLVLYVLRLDQQKDHFRADWDLDHLKATCGVKHTFNYGGCVTVRRKWLLEMNGYEQLPFLAGYHYCGRDNYTRFKNMGLKIAWPPTLRIYHPWHPLPGREKRDTIPQQEELIMRRSTTWEWLAYDGIDPARNRPYDPGAPIPSGWPTVRTECGALANPGATAPRRQESLLKRAALFFPRRGIVGGCRRAARRLLGRPEE